MTSFLQEPLSNTSFAAPPHTETHEHNEDILIMQKPSLNPPETLRKVSSLIARWVPGELHYTICFPPEFEGTTIALSHHDSRS